MAQLLGVTVLCLLAVSAATDAGLNTSTSKTSWHPFLDEYVNSLISDFNRVPRSVSALVNSTVKFTCQAGWELASASVVWYINDTVWSQLTIRGIFWSSLPDSRWNSPLRTLHIPALRDCNNSRVQCVLYLDSGQDKIYSEEAILIVRGIYMCSHVVVADHCICIFPISESFFHHTPQSINATLGSTALFHCHPSLSNGVVTWKINNMSLVRFNSSDVVSMSELDNTWNITKISLHVKAHHMLNNSVVQCILDSNNQQVTTDEAILLIQGNTLGTTCSC